MNAEGLGFGALGLSAPQLQEHNGRFLMLSEASQLAQGSKRSRGKATLDKPAVLVLDPAEVKQVEQDVEDPALVVVAVQVPAPEAEASPPRVVRVPLWFSQPTEAWLFAALLHAVRPASPLRFDRSEVVLSNSRTAYDVLVMSTLDAVGSVAAVRQKAAASLKGALAASAEPHRDAESVAGSVASHRSSTAFSTTGPAMQGGVLVNGADGVVALPRRVVVDCQYGAVEEWQRVQDASDLSREELQFLATRAWRAGHRQPGLAPFLPQHMAAAIRGQEDEVAAQEEQERKAEGAGRVHGRGSVAFAAGATGGTGGPPSPARTTATRKRARRQTLALSPLYASKGSTGDRDAGSDIGDASDGMGRRGMSQVAETATAAAAGDATARAAASFPADLLPRWHLIRVLHIHPRMRCTTNVRVHGVHFGGAVESPLSGGSAAIRLVGHDAADPAVLVPVFPSRSLRDRFMGRVFASLCRQSHRPHVPPPRQLDRMQAKRMLGASAGGRRLAAAAAGSRRDPRGMGSVNDPPSIDETFRGPWLRVWCGSWTVDGMPPPPLADDSDDHYFQEDEDEGSTAASTPSSHAQVHQAPPRGAVWPPPQPLRKWLGVSDAEWRHDIWAVTLLDVPRQSIGQWVACIEHALNACPTVKDPSLQRYAATKADAKLQASMQGAVQGLEQSAIARAAAEAAEEAAAEEALLREAEETGSQLPVLLQRPTTDDAPAPTASARRQSMAPVSTAAAKRLFDTVLRTGTVPPTFADTAHELQRAPPPTQGLRAREQVRGKVAMDMARRRATAWARSAGKAPSASGPNPPPTPSGRSMLSTLTEASAVAAGPRLPSRQEAAARYVRTVCVRALGSILLVVAAREELAPRVVDLVTASFQLPHRSLSALASANATLDSTAVLSSGLVPPPEVLRQARYQATAAAESAAGAKAAAALPPFLGGQAKPDTSMPDTGDLSRNAWAEHGEHGLGTHVGDMLLEDDDSDDDDEDVMGGMQRWTAGAVAVGFSVLGSSFAFVGHRTAATPEQPGVRLGEYRAIMRGLNLKPPADSSVRGPAPGEDTVLVQEALGSHSTHQGGASEHDDAGSVMSRFSAAAGSLLSSRRRPQATSHAARAESLPTDVPGLPLSGPFSEWYDHVFWMADTDSKIDRGVLQPDYDPFLVAGQVAPSMRDEDEGAVASDVSLRDIRTDVTDMVRSRGWVVDVDARRTMRIVQHMQWQELSGRLGTSAGLGARLKAAMDMSGTAALAELSEQQPAVPAPAFKSALDEVQVQVSLPLPYDQLVHHMVAFTGDAPEAAEAPGQTGSPLSLQQSPSAPQPIRVPEEEGGKGAGGLARGRVIPMPAQVRSPPGGEHRAADGGEYASAAGEGVPSHMQGMNVRVDPLFLPRCWMPGAPNTALMARVYLQLTGDVPQRLTAFAGAGEDSRAIASMSLPPPPAWKLAAAFVELEDPERLPAATVTAACKAAVKEAGGLNRATREVWPIEVRTAEASWRVLRSTEDIYHLAAALQATMQLALPPLPPLNKAGVFTTKARNNAARQKAVQLFLKQLVSCPAAWRSPLLAQFLDNPLDNTLALELGSLWNVVVAAERTAVQLLARSAQDMAPIVDMDAFGRELDSEAIFSGFVEQVVRFPPTHPLPSACGAGPGEAGNIAVTAGRLAFDSTAHKDAVEAFGPAWLMPGYPNRVLHTSAQHVLDKVTSEGYTATLSVTHSHHRPVAAVYKVTTQLPYVALPPSHYIPGAAGDEQRTTHAGALVDTSKPTPRRMSWFSPDAGPTGKAAPTGHGTAAATHEIPFHAVNTPVNPTTADFRFTQGTKVSVVFQGIAFRPNPSASFAPGLQPAVESAAERFFRLACLAGGAAGRAQDTTGDEGLQEEADAPRALASPPHHASFRSMAPTLASVPEGSRGEPVSPPRPQQAMPPTPRRTVSRRVSFSPHALHPADAHKPNMTPGASSSAASTWGDGDGTSVGTGSVVGGAGRLELGGSAPPDRLLSDVAKVPVDPLLMEKDSHVYMELHAPELCGEVLVSEAVAPGKVKRKAGAPALYEDGAGGMNDALLGDVLATAGEGGVPADPDGATVYAWPNDHFPAMHCSTPDPRWVATRAVRVLLRRAPSEATRRFSRSARKRHAAVVGTATVPLWSAFYSGVAVGEAEVAAATGSRLRNVAPDEELGPHPENWWNEAFSCVADQPICTGGVTSVRGYGFTAPVMRDGMVVGTLAGRVAVLPREEPQQLARRALGIKSVVSQHVASMQAAVLGAMHAQVQASMAQEAAGEGYEAPHVPSPAELGLEPPKPAPLGSLKMLQQLLQGVSVEAVARESDGTSKALGGNIYQVEVVWGGVAWQVRRTTSQLRRLHALLKHASETMPGMAAVRLPSLPGSSLFTGGGEGRQDAWSGFLQAAVQHPALWRVPEALAVLDSPERPLAAAAPLFRFAAWLRQLPVKVAAARCHFLPMTADNLERALQGKGKAASEDGQLTLQALEARRAALISSRRSIAMLRESPAAIAQRMAVMAAKEGVEVEGGEGAATSLVPRAGTVRVADMVQQVLAAARGQAADTRILNIAKRNAATVMQALDESGEGQDCDWKAVLLAPPGAGLRVLASSDEAVATPPPSHATDGDAEGAVGEEGAASPTLSTHSLPAVLQTVPQETAALPRTSHVLDSNPEEYAFGFFGAGLGFQEGASAAAQPMSAEASSPDVVKDATPLSGDAGASDARAEEPAETPATPDSPPASQPATQESASPHSAGSAASEASASPPPGAQEVCQAPESKRQDVPVLKVPPPPPPRTAAQPSLPSISPLSQEPSPQAPPATAVVQERKRPDEPPPAPAVAVEPPVPQPTQSVPAQAEAPMASAAPARQVEQPPAHTDRVAMTPKLVVQRRVVKAAPAVAPAAPPSIPEAARVLLGSPVGEQAHPPHTAPASNASTPRPKRPPPSAASPAAIAALRQAEAEISAVSAGLRGQSGRLQSARQRVDALLSRGPVEEVQAAAPGRAPPSEPSAPMASKAQAAAERHEAGSRLVSLSELGRSLRATPGPAAKLRVTRK